MINKAIEKALEERGIEFEYDAATDLYRVYLDGTWEDFTGKWVPRDIKKRILAKRILH